MTTPRFLTRVTLAATLDCSVRHVDYLDSQGRLPRSIRLGRLKRWRASEIDAWIAAGCPARDKFEAMHNAVDQHESIRSSHESA